MNSYEMVPRDGSVIEDKGVNTKGEIFWKQDSHLVQKYCFLFSCEQYFISINMWAEQGLILHEHLIMAFSGVFIRNKLWKDVIMA